jgi:hypothetical protein
MLLVLLSEIVVTAIFGCDKNAGWRRNSGKIAGAGWPVTLRVPLACRSYRPTFGLGGA